MLLILFLFFGSITRIFATQTDAGVYKLPELVVFANSSYLIRDIETELECRIAGQPVEWVNTTLDRLLWIKDGTPINELVLPNNLALDKVWRFDANGLRSSIEGDYQCSAIVRNIQLGNSPKVVDTRLVSAPLKMRRARITKFEVYEVPNVRVRQGQVARLACHGLPDVIPGPPEIWFEKHGHEGIPLGRTGKILFLVKNENLGNERFIATTSGLQIALAQPTDGGRYFCLVRNTFTNQTRKSPRPIVLIVEPVALLDYYQKNVQNNNGMEDEELFTPSPRIIYPLQLSDSINKSKPPIDFHVLAGSIALLECVIWDAKIVNINDAGIYVCHGIPLNKITTTNELMLKADLKDFPQISYRLIVHSPTNVRLLLTQQMEDKSWQVYVNGLTLIETMEEMGIAKQTNFYTNPINVTIRAMENNLLAGSVQCISKPAMDEAEIYGLGLERGRSMNLYVDSITSSIPLNRHLITTTNVPLITKDSTQQEIKVLEIQRASAFVAGDNSVRVQWTLTPADHRELVNLKNIVVEYRNRSLNNEDIEESEEDNVDLDSKDWQVYSAEIPSHVRAHTFKTLTSGYRYQFRVRAEFLDKKLRLISEPTTWVTIEGQNSNENVEAEVSRNSFVLEKMRKVIPHMAPMITRLQTVSYESMLVGWNHSSSIGEQQLDSLVDEKAEEFIVKYSKVSDRNWSKKIIVNATSTEILLTELEPDTEYEVVVTAQNRAGQSPESRSRIARTYEFLEERRFTDKSTVWWSEIRRDYLNLPELSLKFLIMFGILCLAGILLLVLGCMTAIRLRQWLKQEKASRNYPYNSAKFFGAIQTSSSHKIRKRDKQIYHEAGFFAAQDPIADLSPLGCYDNEMGNDSPSFIKPNKTSDNPKISAANQSIIFEADYMNGQQLRGESIGGNTTTASTTKMPNLYGNPEIMLGDLMEDIYGSRAMNNILSMHSSQMHLNSNPQHSLNTATLSRASSRRLNPPLMSRAPPPMHSPSNRNHLEDANTYYNDFVPPGTTTIVGGSMSNCSSTNCSPPLNQTEGLQPLLKTHPEENHGRPGNSYSPDSCTITNTTNSTVLASDSVTNSPPPLSVNVDYRHMGNEIDSNILSHYNKNTDYGNIYGPVLSSVPASNYKNSMNMLNWQSEPLESKVSAKMSTFKATQNFSGPFSNNSTSTLDRRKKRNPTISILPGTRITRDDGDNTELMGPLLNNNSSLMMRSMTKLT